MAARPAQQALHAVDPLERHQAIERAVDCGGRQGARGALAELVGELRVAQRRAGMAARRQHGDVPVLAVPERHVERAALEALGDRPVGAELGIDRHRHRVHERHEAGPDQRVGREAPCGDRAVDQRRGEAVGQAEASLVGVVGDAIAQVGRGDLGHRRVDRDHLVGREAERAQAVDRPVGRGAAGIELRPDAILLHRARIADALQRPARPGAVSPAIRSM